LGCGPAEAVRIALDAANGKNVEVFSPTIGRQPISLHRLDDADPASAVNVRYRPMTTGMVPADRLSNT